VLLVSADVSDEKQVKAMIEQIMAKFGKIDVLVNNAGVAIDKEFEERTVKDREKTL
jgi:gluconate 5-dehydrogenase